jgi:hypothetical protein
MKVFLVVDCHNAPGRVLAVFADKEDAEWFADAIDTPCDVEPRTLWYGQPPNRGFNE